MAHAYLVINADARPAGEHARRYNRRLVEVSLHMTDEPGSRDVVLRLRRGGLQIISDTNRAFDPLHFVILFPNGTDRWHLDLTHVNSTKRVTCREFYAYRLQHRPNETDILLRGCRLLQEYCCTAFAKVENQRLTYYRNSQQTLRAEQYGRVRDALYVHNQQGTAQPPAVGRPIILPPSHTGSPRDTHRRYLDAMAIVRKFHKPDLFITVTCNTRWPEITQALLPGPSAEDRPDIVARVFKLKLKTIIDDFTKEGVYGKTVAHLYVV